MDHVDSVEVVGAYRNLHIPSFADMKVKSLMLFLYPNLQMALSKLTLPASMAEKVSHPKRLHRRTKDATFFSAPNG